jgi:hypothetical protein
MEKKKEGGLGIAILVLIILVAVGSEGLSESEPIQTVTPTPTSTSTEMLSPVPLGIKDEKVWRIIEVGVQNAKANGIECDPYLLLALQEVFTGGFYCDETWQEVARPNECACQEDVVGMFQFFLPTFERNAQRYGIESSVWNPTVSAEVVCYFIHDEAQISLDQTEEKFISEFTQKGFIYNIYTADAEAVYLKGQELLELNSKGGY